MRDKIVVEDINVKENKIEYKIRVDENIKKYFNLEKNMWIEYDCNIEGIPEGIAVIPLLTNLIQMAWFLNIEIVVNEVDKKFYDCLDKVKEGYKNMFKMERLNGKLTVKNIVDYSYKPSDKSVMFFSGGVDSLATYITVRKEKPALATVWGSDIALDDIRGWNLVKDEINQFATERGLNTLFITSSFREFINEINLDKAVNLVTDTEYGWWFGVQHGIGLIGHLIPYAYINKIKTIYIAASLNNNSINYVCASFPTTDGNVRAAGVKVIHEGFENTRQDKIKIICDYIKSTGDNMKIRVCWETKGGKNCSKCEKCSRTIMGILAEKMDPNKMGFNITDEDIKKIEYEWKYIWKVHGPNIMHWKDIQNRYLEDKSYWEDKPEKWILKINFQKEGNIKHTFAGRIRRKIYNVSGKSIKI